METDPLRGGVRRLIAKLGFAARAAAADGAAMRDFANFPTSIASRAAAF